MSQEMKAARPLTQLRFAFFLLALLMGLTTTAQVCPFTVNLQSITPSTCNGPTGSIRIFAPTGGLAPYTYSWNTSPLRTSQNLLSVMPGTYTLTVRDRRGCVVTRTWTITNTPDVTPPTIQCKAPIIVNTEPGLCGAYINFVDAMPIDYRTGGPVKGGNKGTPSATARWGTPLSVTVEKPLIGDECNEVTISGVRLDGQPLDALYQLGNTSILWTATDAAGNTATCTQVYTVVDVEAPVLTNVPAAIVDTAEFAGCGRIITWTLPTATDNCSALLSSSHPSGSYFGVGTTNVTYTAADPTGNSNTETFSITILDTQKPIILTCAPAVVVAAGPDCRATATLPGPTASDNCPSSELVYSNDAPATFPIGTTTVTWSVRDGAGNTATCTQLVTVTDSSVPVPLVDNLPEVTGECSATVTAPSAQDCDGVITATTADPTTYTTPGTYTVRWVYTDAAGNSATQQQQVTVYDTVPPSIECPASITVAADQRCGRFVNVGQATGSDNCSVTVTGVRADGKSLTDCYPVGTTVITWTAVDGAGHRVSCTQQVTVTEIRISGTVFNDGNGNTDGLINGTPISNAGGSLYVNLVDDATQTIVASSALTNGTFSFGSADGLFAGISTYRLVLAGSASATAPGLPDATQWKHTGEGTGGTAGDGTVNGEYVFGAPAADGQVIDFGIKQQPVVTCPAALTLAATGCGATPAITAPSYAPASASLGSSRSDGQSMDAAYPLGTTTITWTVTDAAGEAVSCTQAITVTDNTSPVLSTPAPIVHCTDGAGDNEILSAAVTDNCVSTISWTLSGATTGSGTGATVQAGFPIGVTTVTWTATDAAGNLSTGSTTVTIYPRPTAAISVTGQDDLCNRTTLTGTGGSSYEWINGSTTVGTASALALPLAGCSNPAAPGCSNSFQLYVTDANGCRSAVPATYTHTPPANTDLYTIVGLDNVSLGESNDVQTGSVGVNGSTGKASIGSASKVNGAGAFVKAPVISAAATATVPGKILAPAGYTLPAQQSWSGSYTGLANHTVAANSTVTLGANYGDLYVSKGATVTLTGSTFRAVTIEEGAKVTFTASTLNLQTLVVGNGNNNNIATANFAANSNVRISGSLTVGMKSVVNAPNYRVTFYLGADAAADKVYVKGGGAVVNGIFYAPTGTIRVGTNQGVPTTTAPTASNCTQNNSCIYITYKGYVQNSNGTYTVTFQVMNTCGNAVSNMAFELSTGTALSWTKSSSIGYSAENTTTNPFRSLKLNTIGEGIKNGQTETISYTMKATQLTAMSTIRVAVKYANNTATASFSREGCGSTVIPATCTPSTLNGLFVAKQVISDKCVNWNAFRCDGSLQRTIGEVVKGSEPAPAATGTMVTTTDGEAAGASVTAFPNPTKGDFRLLLRGFAAGPVQVQVINASGVVVAGRQLTVGLKEELHPVSLPVLTPGLYSVRVSGRDGALSTRIVIAR
ncbi:HYR domain-containing protein [Flaviaesturariibacter amylovorans]|uniref:HYR domain-containing protein n=1 Tax=Flaviaesturariibacter amylovorans TaxID=1084520 RepID=A0ABP8HQV4_9BACT